MTNAPDGTPITPTGGDESITLTKAEHEQLIQRVAELKQASVSTVEELKELREINAKLKAQVEGSAATDNVDAAVQKALAAKEAEQAKANYQAAVASFLDRHPEFSKENDTDGSKFAAFQKAVQRINMGGLKTTQEFIEALSDAYGLMERKETPAPANTFSSSPRGGSSVPTVPANNNLSPAQDVMVKRYFNGDTEAYLKARQKRPEYYDELEKYIR